MSPPRDTLASSRLRQLAQRPREEDRAQGGGQEAEQEFCELCNAPIPPEHRHIVDLETRALMCACRPCGLLFESKAAAGGRRRLVPDRRLHIEEFELDEALWTDLRIPVDMAFFFESTQAERVVAFYPGPMGATESQLELGAWQELVAQNPVLNELEPDVEALLVNRARGTSGHWIVPIDECYDLVGLIRMYWKGLSGGQEVWTEISSFFERLERRAKSVDREGRRKRPSEPAASVAGNGKEPTWPTT
ncbi:MAG TPA: DUF5947 family protein [Thermoleophilaceae bacterium]|nr:DUF5947 family protein [Thermoleophilaceae bacterium]